jgi:hypothetical protein
VAYEINNKSMHPDLIVEYFIFLDIFNVILIKMSYHRDIWVECCKMLNIVKLFPLTFWVIALSITSVQFAEADFVYITPDSDLVIHYSSPVESVIPKSSPVVPNDNGDKAQTKTDNKPETQPKPVEKNKTEK